MKKKFTGRPGKGFKIFILCYLFLFWAGYGYADGEYSKTLINLKASHENLEQVLNKITNLAHVYFFYNHSFLDLQKEFNLEFKEQTLENILSIILADQHVAWKYEPNRTIVIQPQKLPQTHEQPIKISGQVIDDKTSEPLPGASIVIAGQRTIGVVTDVNGKFTMEIPGSINALNVSFVGYETKTIHLEDKSKLSALLIRLVPAVVEMEDVVVTGMSPRKVEGFTGSYVTVKGDVLKKLSPNNLLKALQIFDPSFHIVENNERGSDPNTMPEFHLRGDAQIGEINSSGMEMLLGDYSNRPNMPLFILDGFEASLQRIVDLDPERVESITILKDAAATAIYGSRAANGVLVFETKQPLPGALNVSYATNIGISVPDLTDYNMMNAAEKLQFEYDAGLFDPNSSLQMNYYNHYKSEVLKGVDTYWLSAPLQTSVTHRHTLSLEGGDQALRYHMSLNYASQPGVMKKSDRRTMGLTLNLKYRRKKWNIGNQLNLADTKGNNSPYGSFRDYTKLNPYYRKTDENGQYQRVLDEKFMGVGTSAESIANPLYNTQFAHKDMSQNFNITDNLSIECAILENLRASAQASFSKGTAKSEIFKSKNHTDFREELDLTKQGSYSKSLANNFQWSANASVNYNLTAKKHLLSFLGRFNIEESRNDGVNLSAQGFPNDNMTDFLFAYTMSNRVNGSEATSRSLGVIGQVSYMYDYRYAADFSIRGDLSSRFGKNTKMAPFWSVGARWNVHKEKWLADTWMTHLVIRGSYGITGAQNYAPYQAVETYTFNNMLYPYLSSDVIGAELMGFGNSDLGWSKTKNRSFAIELGFWKNRINASFNYYNNYTDALLLNYTIAPSTGFNSMKTNAGAVENAGYDLSFSVMPIQDYERQIQWIISWNGSHNRNRIKKISNFIKAMNEANLKNEGAPVPIYEEGKSTTQLFAVQSLGIDPASGKEIFLKRSGEKTYEWNAADKIAWGDSEPTMRGAVSSSLTWKNLSVSVACSYEFGADRYNQTLVDKIENANIGYNLDKRAAQNRWRQTGDLAKYKAMSLYGQETKTSSRFISRFNEFRMSSLAMGYRFEQKKYKFLEECRIASISLNASFQDIFRLSTVKQERGLSYPFARAFNLSLSVLFK